MNKTIILITGFAIGVFAGSNLEFNWIKAMAQDQPKYKNFYYVSDKTPFAQCMNWVIKEGCMELFDCTAGKKYHCVTNIWTE